MIYKSLGARKRNKMDRQWSKEKEQKDYKPLHENPLETANQSCILSFRHMTHDPFNVFKFFVCCNERP
jgi:hypothetical protein